MASAVEAGGSNGHYGGGGGGAGGGRLPRLPRWTRQEILVLIQGKRVVESRGRGRGRGAAGVVRSGEEGAAAVVVAAAGPVEPKWVSVSSYCGRRGVNRGPVQCRKRWSNLSGDFKKIKEWEVKGKESFWTMRNDVRRERRLPGFFDREVYDILDGAALPEPEAETTEEVEGKKKGGRTSTSAVDEEEAVFDSGRTAAADGLFSDLEEDKEAEEEDDPAAPPPQPVAAVPISEKEWESAEQGRSDSGQATTKDKQEDEDEEEEEEEDDDDIPEKGSPTHSHQGQKRRRTSPEVAAEDSDLQLQGRLIEVLERNNRMLTAQLEAQNLNYQLDRDLRKDQAKSLLNVLGKLADALGKIADKL